MSRKNPVFIEFQNVIISKTTVLKSEPFALSFYNYMYIYRLDPVYTEHSCRHDIEFGQFAVIFTLTIFSMISCY